MALMSRVSPLTQSVNWPKLPRRLPSLPVALGLAVIAGLTMLNATTPILRGGDLGQWLMTSRYYLGQSVPAYRDIGQLPPLVPFALAVIQVVVPDPLFALNIVTSALTAGVAAAFFLLGRTILANNLGGVLSLAALMLITDPVLELLSFGGLLQAAATMFMCLSLSAFVMAGRRKSGRRNWWLAGGVAATLMALSHVGTALTALPVLVVVAALSAFRPARPLRDRLRAVVRPVGILAAVLGFYALFILLPASHEYVANPASLAYRGPDSFLSGLLGYWPNALVIFFGAGCLLVGMANELYRRKIGPYVLLSGWAATVWGLLGYSILTNVATDYPRFSTVILPPLALAAAGGALWLARAVAMGFTRARQTLRLQPWLLATGALIVLVSTPVAVSRYGRLASYYQPLDPSGLSSAVGFLGSRFGLTGGTILTPVREGKWLEGITGLPALFAQPVRYSFRPDEWQRSLDADTLYRSALAMTNGYFFVKYTSSMGSGTTASPAGLLVSINHGGEYVDLVSVSPSDTWVSAAAKPVTMASMSAAGSQRTLTPTDATVRSRFTTTTPSGPMTLAQSVELLRSGSALHLVDQASSGGVGTLLSAAGNLSITSSQLSAQEADVCFTQVGDEEPCVRIWAAQPDASVSLDGNAIRVQTTTSKQLDLFVTVLSHSSPWAPLAILDPATLVAQDKVVGAMLINASPAFPARLQRLERLGFVTGGVFGQYTVLVHQ
jgi:hypothetical protein